MKTFVTFVMGRPVILVTPLIILAAGAVAEWALPNRNASSIVYWAIFIGALLSALRYTFAANDNSAPSSRK